MLRITRFGLAGILKLCRLAVALSCVALFACGDDPVIAPSEPPSPPPPLQPVAPRLPPSLTIVAGNNQKGRVGVTLSEPLIVRVSDERGTGLADADVQWIVARGEGALQSMFHDDGSPMTAITTRTNAEGLARVSLIPTVFQLVYVDAGIAGVQGTRSFAVDATDSGAALTIISGFNQKAKAGQQLDEPLVVRVTNGQGDPVPHVMLVWEMIYGEGAFSGDGHHPVTTGGQVMRRTDATGLARVSFAPTWFGPIELTVTAPGIAHSIPFTADATDNLAALSIASGDNQEGKAGEYLVAPFVVRVTDGGGNVVPNVRVNWSLETGCCYGYFEPNWNSFEKASTYSDGNGLARVSFLPLRLGPLPVRAQLAGLHARVGFTAYATVVVIAFGDFGGPTFYAPWSDWGGDTDVSVPVGTPVEWVNYRSTARFRSTSVPAGGEPFDSGILQTNARFRFVPGVAGTWEYVDQVSGAKATLTVF